MIIVHSEFRGTNSCNHSHHINHIAKTAISLLLITPPLSNSCLNPLTHSLTHSVTHAHRSHTNTLTRTLSQTELTHTLFPIPDSQGNIPSVSPTLSLWLDDTVDQSERRLTCWPLIGQRATGVRPPPAPGWSLSLTLSLSLSLSISLSLAFLNLLAQSLSHTHTHTHKYQLEPK